MTALVLSLAACDGGAGAEDAGASMDTGADVAAPTDSSTTEASVDALGLDAPGLDAPGLDAPGLDAPGLDAPGLDAHGLDAPGLDAHGLDAPGLDAPGLDAPGLDAQGPDGSGHDASSRDANVDAGSRADRCSVGCDYVASCGYSCGTLGVVCATASEEQACTLDCLRSYACAEVPGVGLTSCSSSCRTPVDAALPDVFADDTRADAGSFSTRCSAGCDFLLACGASSCAALGVDCAMATETQACLADCIRGFSCFDVPGAGLTYCTGRCSASTDAGPPSDTGPTAAACTGCAMSSCSAELGPCLADGTCSQLAFCVASCEDVACRDDCLTRYPATATLRDPVLSCLCTDCAAPCARIDICSL